MKVVGQIVRHRELWVVFVLPSGQWWYAKRVRDEREAMGKSWRDLLYAIERIYLTAAKIENPEFTGSMWTYKAVLSVDLESSLSKVARNIESRRRQRETQAYLDSFRKKRELRERARHRAMKVLSKSFEPHDVQAHVIYYWREH